MVAYSLHPSTREAKTGGFLSVRDHSSLHREFQTIYIVKTCQKEESRYKRRRKTGSERRKGGKRNQAKMDIISQKPKTYLAFWKDQRWKTTQVLYSRFLKFRNRYTKPPRTLLSPKEGYSCRKAKHAMNI